MATSTTPPPYLIIHWHSTRATRQCWPRCGVLLAIALFERIARAPFRRNLARIQACIDTRVVDALCKACFDIRAVLAHLLAHIVTGVADALLEIDLCIIVKRFIEDEIGAKARLDDLHDHAVLLELARITLGI